MDVMTPAASGRPGAIVRATSAAWWPVLLDALCVVSAVAVGWAGMWAAGTDPSVEAAPLSVAMGVIALVAAVPLWWRRRAPLIALAAATAVTVVAPLVDERGLFAGQIGIELAVLAHAIASWSPHRRRAAVTLATVAAFLLLGGIGDGGSVLVVVAYVAALVALPAAIGVAARARRERLAEVEARLESAERDRDLRARIAVRDERARIARELHDVVAHHVSLIGVQAGAARVAGATGGVDDPELTRALGSIESSSRAAVAELRQLLDVLEPLPDGANAGAGDLSTGVRAPAPGLAEVPSLIDGWRGHGLELRAQLVGDPGDVPEAVGLCCYRVIEEALTNVVRHSGAGSADVEVRVLRERSGSDAPPAAGGRVELAVVDGGPPTHDGSGGGRGLVGMRQRVGLVGGSLSVGPMPGGGFAVRAVVPWSSA